MPTMQLTGRRFAFAVAFLPATAWSAVHAQAPTVATKPARQAPPAPGTPKDFRVPPRRSFDLPNGMRVTLVPYGRVPKAAVELTVRTGI
ncbi:MAG: hypothetical protein IT358_06130, partial [Gemmatimonadaceae bacterium]|nr:hypothetical protein [Gemmatimonadaceae bacterium]